MLTVRTIKISNRDAYSRVKAVRRWLLTTGLLLALILTLLGPAASEAQAASHVINGLKEGSLGQAILAANAAPGEDTITFNVSGTILLTKTLPTITDPAGLTIDGAGQNITISGNNAVSVMWVAAGAAATLRNLTIAGGYSGYGGGLNNGGTLNVSNITFSGNKASYGGSIHNNPFGTLSVTESIFSGNKATSNGGAIYNYGIATVTDSILSANEAVNGGGIYNDASFNGISPNAGTLDVTHNAFLGNIVSGDGGGIYNFRGTTTVANSTFSANSANRGGGIFHAFDTMTVTGSTFSGNIGFSNGGGFSNPYGSIASVTSSTFSANTAPSGGGIYNSGRLTVTGSTLVENDADSGGGIYNCCLNNGSILTLQNSLVANSNAVNCLNGGTLVDGGGNLSWPDTSCPGLNANPLLDPLQDNGGPTQTHALLAGSPAIDAALLADCPATDQRGVDRPQGPGCDIGAYELGVESIPPTIIINTPADQAIYFLGQVVTADYLCQDEAGGSGLASCIGPVPDDSPIDSASLGAKIFSVDAADNAGNFASLTLHFSVVYGFSGFFQPVDDLPTMNVVPAGVGVPVRFSLSSNHGLSIFTSGYPASSQIPCTGGASEDAIEETVKVRASSLSYDAALNTYTYMWKTNTAWVDTCRQLNVRLNDGTEHTANFRFVK